jgi:predicted enzyme related to lactoylglutathione lyase
VRVDICIDVDDVGRAVAFYGQGLGLTIVEQHAEWAQVKVGEQTIWIMKAGAGSDGIVRRDYSRHWTPVHLDFHVDDIDAAVARAVAGGGRLDRAIIRHPERGDLANLSDPAGNGVDLVRTK